MEIFIISFLIILLAVTGMAIGVLIGDTKRRIKGSCGGLANIPGMEGECCGACKKDPMPENTEHP
uniref:(Na+)-NQR maturation NqrM n=1 Tax=Candidatus Kentrum sp. TUN TaxID=2126343 RepID=A0A450ZIZ8_9GAMM|nr:MAG: hypothetical protein BECKTUN1418F_GA0071002_10289 [Candidatus Kentron sp. TUN]VFK57769.1 MAG: hypothetical protein BECKTUN1418D_GA0071000_106910 [Candidatus Kentron sp. TUN]VFK61554.1 MAG: hypothetical protein BECKTUN1418E_GA0071001_10685 [Candidatus Kentron sp. TUN]